MLTNEITADIEINAPADQVWEALTDFASYREWNPFLCEVRGKAETGERLRVTFCTKGEKTTSFRPRVLSADPEHALRWKGRLLVPGLFDGEHMFHVEPIDKGRTRFIQYERFSGLLIPFLQRYLEEDVKANFQKMNLYLKDWVEQDR